MQDKEQALQQARKLMEEFVLQTGIAGESGDSGRRYLWTDAFAVQALLGLWHELNKTEYRDFALKLIEEVHERLGKFAPGDKREGWISGLSEEEGKKHPTRRGLRIGKKMPERPEGEAYQDRLEWERDGQYFHYHTRWINALLEAAQQTGEKHLIENASELSCAGRHFITQNPGRLHMYWKMSVDLSRPLVPSMGAHDPLEGLLCALSIRAKTEKRPEGFDDYQQKLQQLCSGSDWSTTDPLGIGGLLLNVIRAAELQQNTDLPASVKPQKLINESFGGLRAYLQMHNPSSRAYQRLAFRECGFSLGVNVLQGCREQLESAELKLPEMEDYVTMARGIEEFWSQPENQQAPSWTDHQEINAVSLASSLIARSQPQVFGNLADQ